jgi:hypothetical protein
MQPLLYAIWKSFLENGVKVENAKREKVARELR